MKRLTMALLCAVACAQPLPGNDAAPPPDAGQSAGGQAQDWAAIERLEGQARTLAQAVGCTGADGCRTAPVGNRACGGPRYYLVYCAASTDSAALYRKLDEVAAAENAYNQRYQIGSTCEFRMPPEVTIAEGQCKAAE